MMLSLSNQFVAHFITVLFWIATALLLIGLYRRSLLWRAGAPAKVSMFNLFAIPKRYFVDLHHVVARDPYIARTHVAAAGGAIAALGLVAINYGLALYSSVLNWAIVLAAGIMFVGVFFVWLRRRSDVNTPSRLSCGAWSRLPYTLAAFALGLLLVSLPVATLSGGIAFVALLLLIAGSLELALGIGLGGPMKHAIAGLLHLAFHPRQTRFSGELSTALKPLNLENNGEWGNAKPADFAWNQLLGFDACVQCGKCEAACPAFAAGQPLNPKKLIQDLVVGMSGGTDAHYAGSQSPGLALNHSGSLFETVVPSLIEAQTLWACTTCRACVQECPMLIEHVDAIIDMRRNLTLTQGNAPGRAAETLDNLRQTATLGGYALAARYHWAIDLNVKTIQANEPVDILLWAGEGAYDLRYQRTLRALVKVLKNAKVDFAVLNGELEHGLFERDSGDTARRLGDEVTFQLLAKANIATLSKLNFKRILTADPHVLHNLKNEYPALGGHYQVVHHTTLLSELVSSNRLKLKQFSETRTLTYHDPCYLGRYNGETESPRALLHKMGLQVTEMERSGMRGRCCGGGGGAPITDVPSLIKGSKRIPDIRIADARTIGAEVIAVACPQCTAMLEGVVERPEVLDIAELVANALDLNTIELNAVEVLV